MLKQEKELQGQCAALESIATASLWRDPRLRLRDPEWNRRFMELPGDMPEGEQRWWADQRLAYLRMGLHKRQAFRTKVLAACSAGWRGVVGHPAEGCACAWCTGSPVVGELEGTHGMSVQEWKRATDLRERLLFQRTVLPVGSPGWNRVVHGETGLSDEMLSTVGWVDTAGAAPLSRVQAGSAEMDGAVEMGDCLRGRPDELGRSVGAEGSALAMTDMPVSTGAAEAEAVSMTVEVAADRDECLLAKLGEVRRRLLEGEGVRQWLEQQTALGVDASQLLDEYCDRMLMVDMGVFYSNSNYWGVRELSA